MQRALAVTLLLGGFAACGGESGEPIGGDIAIVVGGETVNPSVGAAIADENGAALVILGTRDITCDTRLETPLKPGTYLTFTVDRNVGAQTPMVSVIRVQTGGAHLNGTAGMVAVDGVGDRITGSVMMTTTDDELGDITVTGTFDVTNC